MADHRALYFGCWDRAGHYLHEANERKLSDPPKGVGFPWTFSHMDSGLLRNGKLRDVYDGKVYWTCGGLSFPDDLWFAFYWWDNSVDKRGASNSGFYVHGFSWGHHEEAFVYACEQFPSIVKRQRQPLVLQHREPT